MFPSFEILGGFYYFLRILWLFQKLFVCLCAHMHIMCACICQNWYLKETPQDDWMQPNSLLYSLSPFPIFLSFPSLSVFPSPIPPLTQSFLKVNPRGIFFLLPLFDFTYSVFGLALGCWSSANAEKWQHWWRVQLGLLSWFQPTSSDWSSRFRPAFSGWFSCWFSLPKLTSGRLVFLSCGCFVVSKSI